MPLQPKLFKKLRTASPLRKAITDETTTSVKIREATVVSSSVRMIQMPCQKAFLFEDVFLFQVGICDRSLDGYLKKNRLLAMTKP